MKRLFYCGVAVMLPLAGMLVAATASAGCLPWSTCVVISGSADDDAVYSRIDASGDRVVFYTESCDWSSACPAIILDDDGTKIDVSQGLYSVSRPSISRDGLFIGFYAQESQFGSTYPYVYDIEEDDLIQVPTATNTFTVPVTTGPPAISDEVSEKRFVAFQTLNLQFPNDLFIQINVWEIGSVNNPLVVSRTSGGTKANAHCDWPAISEDGTKIAFSSAATNLLSGIDNGEPQIYFAEYNSGNNTYSVTECISRSSGGAEGNDDSITPEMDAAGDRVVFDSKATNLVGSDIGWRDIFIRDRSAVTIAKAFQDHNWWGGGDPPSEGHSYSPTISPDGVYVACSTNNERISPEFEPCDGEEPEACLAGTFGLITRPDVGYTSTELIALENEDESDVVKQSNWPSLSDNGCISFDSSMFNICGDGADGPLFDVYKKCGYSNP